MAAKRRCFIDRLDSVRRRLLLEPRGHKGMFAAVLTEAVTPEAAFGPIYRLSHNYFHKARGRRL